MASQVHLWTCSWVLECPKPPEPVFWDVALSEIFGKARCQHVCASLHMAWIVGVSFQQCTSTSLHRGRLCWEWMRQDKDRLKWIKTSSMEHGPKPMEIALCMQLEPQAKSSMRIRCQITTNRHYPITPNTLPFQNPRVWSTVSSPMRVSNCST